MLQGLFRFDVLQLFPFLAPERAARTGQEDSFHRVHVFAGKALEDGRVFRVDRSDGHLLFTGGPAYDSPSGHQGLFIGQRDMLAGLDGFHRGLQACVAQKRGHHGIHAFASGGIGYRIRSGKDLGIGMRQGIADLFVMGLVADDNDIGLEFQRLTDEQIGLVLRCQHFDAKGIRMLADYVQSLRADRACGT